MDIEGIDGVIRHLGLKTVRIQDDTVVVCLQPSHKYYKFKLVQLGPHTWSLQPIPRVVGRIESSTYLLNAIDTYIEDLYGTDRLEYATIISPYVYHCNCRFCDYLDDQRAVDKMCSFVTLDRHYIMGEFMTHEDMLCKLPDHVYWNNDLKVYRIVNYFGNRVGTPRGTGLSQVAFPIEFNDYSDSFKINLGIGQLPMYRFNSGRASIHQRSYYGNSDRDVGLENHEYMIKKLYAWVAQTDFKEV